MTLQRDAGILIFNAAVAVERDAVGQLLGMICCFCFEVRRRRRRFGYGVEFIRPVLNEH